MKELKPCPFCGEKALLVSGEFIDGEYQEYTSNVKCKKCGARAQIISESMPLKEVEEIAISSWNTRHNECDSESLIKLADQLEYEKDTRWIANEIRKALGEK